jgi:RNA recognition motif-containing protein
MGGTGSFTSDCCTLYVGGLGSDHDSVESSLWRAFAEWGTPKKINVITRLNIAFVTYNNRLNAEYAKQAMAGQALDGKVGIALCSHHL